MEAMKRFGSAAYFVCVTLVLSGALWLQANGQQVFAFALIIGSGLPLAWLAERRRESQRPMVARAAMCLMTAASGCSWLLLIDGNVLVGAVLAVNGCAALLITHRFAPPTEKARRKTIEDVSAQVERLRKSGLARTVLTHGVLPGLVASASLIAWLGFHDEVLPSLWGGALIVGLMTGMFTLIAAFGWWILMRQHEGQ